MTKNLKNQYSFVVTCVRNVPAAITYIIISAITQTEKMASEAHFLLAWRGLFSIWNVLQFWSWFIRQYSFGGSIRVESKLRMVKSSSFLRNVHSFQLSLGFETIQHLSNWTSEQISTLAILHPYKNIFATSSVYFKCFVVSTGPLIPNRQTFSYVGTQWSSTAVLVHGCFFLFCLLKLQLNQL